jgi:hypothetical protein
MSIARKVVPPARRASGPPARLSGGTWLALATGVAILAVVSTDLVLPATSEHQAQIRVWLAARAAGFVALGLLTIQVVLGLVLSHPTNRSTWKLSKRLFPWHENLWLFTIAFLAVHVLAIAADEYADVGLVGALVPGLSEYRSAPVALGTMALYALLVTGLSARYVRLLPMGWWLKLHRLSLTVLGLAWMHGLLAGTDSVATAGLYGGSLALVLAATAYRYWVARAGRPTFSTAHQEVSVR